MLFSARRKTGEIGDRFASLMIGWGEPQKEKSRSDPGKIGRKKSRLWRHIHNGDRCGIGAAGSWKFGTGDSLQRGWCTPQPPTGGRTLGGDEHENGREKAQNKANLRLAITRLAISSNIDRSGFFNAKQTQFQRVEAGISQGQ